MTSSINSIGRIVERQKDSRGQKAAEGRWKKEALGGFFFFFFVESKRLLLLLFLLLLLSDSGLTPLEGVPFLLFFLFSLLIFSPFPFFSLFFFIFLFFSIFFFFWNFLFSFSSLIHSLFDPSFDSILFVSFHFNLCSLSISLLLFLFLFLFPFSFCENQIA